MSRLLRIPVILPLLTLATVVVAKPRVERLEAVSENAYVDRVGNVDGTGAVVRKTAEDTIWIADWTFDGSGGVCEDTGWERADHRVLRGNYGPDGVLWSVKPDFDGQGGISGNAAVCGITDPCCATIDGYGNAWYQAIRIEYSGSGSLSFDYLLDSEPDGDFIFVELDSACASFHLTDQDGDGVLDDPSLGTRDHRFWVDISYAAKFRRTEFQDSGENFLGHVDALPITDFGTNETHCIYIAFASDPAFSPCDARLPTTLGAATVVDNIVLEGVDSPILETFEGTLDPRVEFVNLWDEVGLGEWARVFKHPTDNDKCTDNTTCAWLFTDNATPTLANDPSMAFGPGAYITRSWFDNSIVSPWVSLAGTKHAVGTVISWREFGGNTFAHGRVARNWAVRGKVRIENSDPQTPGDSVDCARGRFGPRLADWGGDDWNILDRFSWTTVQKDMTISMDSSADEMQVRFRIADLQWAWRYVPPAPFVPGPGPYIDRVRIGRRVLTGPKFTEWRFSAGDSRYQAQDAFPTELDPSITPGTGEHHRPTTDRFGTAAFSASRDLGYDYISPNLITADSIVIWIRDERGAGGVTRVDWYGSIVSGPHAGKAPPPWTVGGNGFFVVPADSARTPDGTINPDSWFVDLDDDYLRGGDVLRYFWLAEDAQGGVSSNPAGLVGVPNTVEEAEASTGGLFEVNILPTINWDPGYLARIGADPHGKLEPTPEELANSTQANCILYYQFVNNRRLSGDANRTSFMYTLDRLGYQGHYDIYDMQGLGNTNNQLGGRATVEQVTGYSLIIQDIGNVISASASLSYLPDGSDLDDAKIDQAGWYRDWLASAEVSEAGTATLWLIGSRLTEVVETNPLMLVDMGVNLASHDILPALGANPDVGGQATFAFANGNTADFSTDQFTVQAACPNFPPYNGLDASGTAAVTHRWKNGAALGDGAIVMNANPTQSWNTIMQVPTWREIRDPNSTPTSPGPEEQLMTQILNGVLLPDCIQSPDPTTDVGDEPDRLDNLPKVTALYQNVPNPFNPVTTIRFDLARDGHVDLRIYDVTGRLVRKLIDESMISERHKLVWDGLDDAGVSVSSGIYFYRLETGDFKDTHKMVVLR